MATSPLKSRVIYVHRNGDKTDKGSRMVLHPIKMRDYEQLKSEMTAKVQLVTGAVRKVFSKETGAEITALDQFEHDKHYVCCGGEKLKIESLSQGASPKPSVVATSGATTPSRAPLLSQNTPEKGKNVYFFRNGDKHYAGAKFVIHSKKYKRFDQLLTDLSIKVGVSTGAVRRVYTASGELIDAMDKLEEGGKYICCGGERFDHENIPKGITGERASPSPAKTPTKRPSTSGTPSSIGRSPKAPIEKFGTQTEKGRVIFAFQNGDKHHKGVRLVIHAKKYKTIEQVKVQLSSQLSLPTGPVQKILRFESLDEKPVEVKDVAAFEDGANYIVCGPEPLNKENIPGTLLEVSAKRSKASAAAAAAAAAADDEPEPEPAHVPEPAPVAVAVEPAHVPVPEPVPVAAEPEPEPEPVAAEPEPEPQAAPAVEPEAAAPVNQDDDDAF